MTPPVANPDLEEIYTNPNLPTSYSGDIQKYIQQKESISLHKKKINIFKRRQIFVIGPWVAIQADTAFYIDTGHQNSGFKYILGRIHIIKLINLFFLIAVIDCFSRKNWVRPMKTATATETAKNLDDIINSMVIKPTQFASGFFLSCLINFKKKFKIVETNLTLSILQFLNYW